jgi:hypothetical protein
VVALGCRAREHGAPPEPPTTAELLVGTWALDPPDADRLAGWKAAIGGAAPKPDDEVGRWLAAHRDGPDARRVLDALAAADDVRLDVTADTLTVRRADRHDSVRWTSWDDRVDDRGHRTLRVRTTTPDGVQRELDVRLADDDHVTLAPTTGQEPATFRRIR